MAYITSVHRPSSVRHALKLCLLDDEQESLVVAKANRLEVWNLQAEGLVLFHSMPVMGTIAMLDKIRPAGSTVDHLFVGTMRFQYFTLAWNPETRALEVANPYVDACEKHMRESQSRNRCAVDSSQRYMILELFEGVLNLVKIKQRRNGANDYLETSDQVRITELRVRSTKFLPLDTKEPRYAMLCYVKRNEPRLITYSAANEKGQWKNFDPRQDKEDDIGNLCPGASFLIPVPKGKSDQQKRYNSRNPKTATAQLGGVIVVGETKMTYLDNESKAVIEGYLEEASIFVAWEQMNDVQFLLGDEYGRLWILELVMEGGFIRSIKTWPIGHTSKAAELVRLQDDMVYVASHEGDNHLIRVRIDGDSSHIEVLQTFANIAPILDFTIMDMGNRDNESQANDYSSGQARLVTGSGVFNEGSLRSVRSGVGLEDTAILADLQSVRAVFPLKSMSQQSPDTVVVSFPIESRVFFFDSHGEIEELDSYRNFALDEETLLARNLTEDDALQITSKSIRIHGTRQKNNPHWTPPASATITAASANANHALVVVDGTTLVVLSLPDLIEVCADSGGDQIACVHVPEDLADVGVVGYWSSGSIKLVSLKDLSVRHHEVLRRDDDASIPRDIALTQILPKETHGPSLFVAMEDGHVVSFGISSQDLTLSGRKSIVLGTQQARLQILPRADGTNNIFATCEHPSLIYASEGKIIFSAVTAEDAVCVCAFDNTYFPDSIILATHEHLKISKIDTERWTHVRSLHMGQTVRRIAYSARERLFGLGCINRELSNGVEHLQSSFRLVDEVLFSELGRPFDFEKNDNLEMIECVTRAELARNHGDHQPAERFLVGTTYLGGPETPESEVRGRLLVFGVDESRSPYLITSHPLKTECRQLGSINGRIVAALIKTIVIYGYDETGEDAASLTKLASYRPSICPMDLCIRGNIIAVADLMKSLALVEYKPGANGLPDSLIEVARHYQAMQSTAVIDIAEGQYLESDAEGNLVILRRSTEGLTSEDRKRLEVISEMNLGEMVNRMHKIDVDMSARAVVVPKAFLATTEGGIYLFATINPSYQDLLIRLQDNMGRMLRTHESIDFNSYRAFKNDTRETLAPWRFIDGDMIEKFLDLREELQAEVCQGLGPNLEDMRTLVERLKGLH